jgi:hypothetical protein
MLPLQSVSTDIVPWATTSPLKTALSGLTPQPFGKKKFQVLRAWLPAGRETAMRRLPLAEGAGEETKISKAGLKGMLLLAISGAAKPKSAARNPAVRRLRVKCVPPEARGEGPWPSPHLFEPFP